jgi:hypothetical protein
VVYFCGVLQTLLYADFFYYYVKRYVQCTWLVLVVFTIIIWPQEIWIYSFAYVFHVCPICLSQ